MMFSALSRKVFGDPIPDDIRNATKRLFSGVHMFVSGQDTEWFQPERPGDELYGFGGLKSIEEKTSEFAGRSITRILRSVRVNQRGEIAAIDRTIVIATERKQSRKRGKYMNIEPATYTDEQIAEIDAIYATEGPRGSTPRHYEDVQVGDQLPKMFKGPMTRSSSEPGGYSLGRCGAKTGTKAAAPSRSKRTCTGIPLYTASTSQSTMLATRQSPGCSTSSTSAIMKGVGTSGWNCW